MVFQYLHLIASTFWPHDWASRIADVCGVISVILTGILTTGAYQVKKQFSRRLFLPKYEASLEEKCHSLTTLLEEYDGNEHVIRRVFHEILADLKSIRPLCASLLRITVDHLTANIKSYLQSPTKDRARECYNLAYGFLAELRNSNSESLFE